MALLPFLCGEKRFFFRTFEPNPSPVVRSPALFAETICRDNRDLHPRDMIDLQSFIWVQGSVEYPD